MEKFEIEKPLRKLIPAFLKARDEKAAESDTVKLLQKLFVDGLGYDLVDEITLEFSIKGCRVDMAVKLNGEVQFLVEAKAADTKKLREHHIRQAKLYAAEAHIQWVLLTSGILWNLYHLTFDEGIETELAFSVDLSADSINIHETSKLLSLLHRHSLAKNELEKFWVRRVALSHKSIAKALFSEKVLTLIRQQIHSHEGVLIDIEDIATELHEFFSQGAKEQMGPLKIYGKLKKTHDRPIPETAKISDATVTSVLEADVSKMTSTGNTPNPEE